MAYNNFWIKLYYEILIDPKMGGMDDHTWRRTIELFLLAGSEGEEGRLPPISDIAWHLRTSQEDIEQVLSTLEQLHIIAKSEDGYIVANFAKRQKKIEPKERMQSLRNRTRSNEYYENTYFQDSVTGRNANSYEDVTSRKTDIDIDIDIDKDIYDDDDNAKNSENLEISAISNTNQDDIREISKAYEQEIGLITPFIREEMIDALEHYPRDWIIEAIHESAEHNARSWKYTAAILKQWQVDGFKADKRVKSRQSSTPSRRNGGITAEVQEIIDNARAKGEIV